LLGRVVLVLACAWAFHAHAQNLGAGLRVFVKEIRVVGATALPARELREIVAPFENRELTSEDLDELRHRISVAYANAGFVNSGAVIPDQDVAGGVVTVQVIEGRLTGVEVTGEHHFRDFYLKNRVALGAGEPLNVRSLQEAIQLMLQNPQIERINAELAPGSQRGEALLRMDVKEARRFSAAFSLANNRSPAVGAIRAELAAAARNLAGLGETLAVRVGKTEGLEDQAVNFAVPVNARDTLFTARYEQSRSRVIEEPFDIIDITSESAAGEVGLSHPFLRNLRSTLTVGTSLYYRDNGTALLGVPFAFPPVDTDKAKVAAWRLFADWVDRTQESVFAARATFSNGLKAFGSTSSTTSGAPDSAYHAVLGQVQWARRLAADGRQVVLRADGQYADDILLPSEKFAVGGIDTVRGYRENQVVRDNGYILSVEYRQPLFHLPIPGLSQAEGAGLVSAAAFIDYGVAWDHHGPASDTQKLWSYGPGLRWDPGEGFFAQLYWGIRGREIPTPHNDLQDRGIHFRLGAAISF
jgi:hemolysin activation/secretion protein